MLGMMATGGYLSLHNHGDSADRLTGVSAGFAKSEIHEMTHDNGHEMRPVKDGVEIPAGGMVTLKPGGLHLMFMGLSEPLKPGRMLEVTLELLPLCHGSCACERADPPPATVRHHMVTGIRMTEAIRTAVAPGGAGKFRKCRRRDPLPCPWRVPRPAG